MQILVSLSNEQDIVDIAKIFHQVSIIHHQQEPNIFKVPKFENDLSYIKSSINQANIKIFKAEIKGKICGYLVMYINSYPEEFFVSSQGGFVGSLGVDDNYRGNGVGKALISGAEDFLKEHNIKLMEIDVYTFNVGAEKLYNSMGYKDIKLFKRKIL